LKFRKIRGTKDILPDEVTGWQLLESIVHRVMQNFNYREIRTPIFEQTGLFARSIGELTDIVSKEMYTFIDRSGDSLTLRPEGTASTLRAYIQNNLGEQEPLVKVYYIGPMFRQERPQAGRWRQFHQFGAEALGASSPQLDVEMIALPLEIYRQLGIDRFAIKINSVGCEKCRPPYKKLIKTELQKIFSQLSTDSQVRVEQNPLRVLDSKDEKDRKLTANVPMMKEHLCEECNLHFASVCSLLDALNITYEIDGRLVRGLDYYTKTAFEITSTALGSQDALAGGGRYDLLVEELGGSSTPGVGFAAGTERLLMVLTKLGKNSFVPTSPSLFFVSLDEQSHIWAFIKANELRSKGICTEVDYLGRSIKSQMRVANRQKAQFVIVVGENELKTKKAKLKNMQTGEETTISLDVIELPSH
jgi:histidyl-tRNA synthetase